MKPNTIPTIFPGSFDEEIGTVDISFDSGNVCPIDVNDGNVLCPECVKKDILYASLRSESYDEKERLNTQIGEMASKIAQLKKNFTKMRKRAYNLMKTGTKLHQTIKDIKQQNLINSKLENLFEVCIHSYCSSK